MARRSVIRRWATAGVLAVAALVAVAAALAFATGSLRPSRTVEIDIHYSHYAPAAVQVPMGVPVTFVIRNDDPIDHEWIVGDAAVQAFHRASTDPLHTGDPTAVSVPALSTVSTTVTFNSAGRLAFICHLPDHEAYGMVGWVTITP
jgi:uncharacterized cupredoxin-like copper-binding protein